MLYRNHWLALGVGAMLFWAVFGSAGAVWARPNPTPDTGWFIDMNRFRQSAHATLTCEQCHGDLREKGREHPDAKAPGFLREDAVRTYDYSRCEPCHREAYARYRAGAHAEALRKERTAAEQKKTAPQGKEAPTCGSCHVAHYVRSGLTRIETGRKMTEVCGACHEAEKASYLQNYHGKAGVNLARGEAAFCTDCHGAHTTTSLKKKEAALTACLRCHPRAKDRFGEFVIHASLENLREKAPDKRHAVVLIHRIKIIAALVVSLVLIFFFGHTLLWFLREFHEKLRKH